jgi:hypothetical protein
MPTQRNNQSLSPALAGIGYGGRPVSSGGDDGGENDWRIKMAIHRDKSLVSLPSEEDLLGRRMKGLAGGLMGIGEGAKTP